MVVGLTPPNENYSVLVNWLTALEAQQKLKQPI
jgi:hypothetical protein